MRESSEKHTRAQMEALSIDHPKSFELLGKEWEIYPGVFPPGRFVSTQLFAELVPFPKGGTFLEIGCGAGLIAIQAALAGCQNVVATDINVEAVRNTERNAFIHGVNDSVDVLVSDVFESLPEKNEFDMIFWNSNFVPMEASYNYRSDFERAFFDPGYRAHRAYLAEARKHLSSNGRLMLGFSSLGDRDELDRIVHMEGYTQSAIARHEHDEGQVVEYELIELIPHA